MALIKKKPQRTAANPLRYDPSGTGPLRRKFMVQMNAKFTELSRRVYRRLTIDNNYGLNTNSLIVNSPYDFPSSHEHLEQFRQWLITQMSDLLYPEDADSWWAEYVKQGWQQGAKKAYDAWKEPSEFLRSSFNQPVSINKVRILASRVLSELKGLTGDMATKMSRSLVDGLTQGWSPRDVARDMAKQIEISRPRALTIARTETVRAHAEGQLDTLEGLGMDQVGVAVEWSVSGVGITRKKNPSPCAVCAPMQGVVFTLQEARGMIPRHPNCMCSFIPANVGEDSSKQTRSYRGISAALAKSIRAEIPKGSKRKNAAGTRRKSRWTGAAAKIDKSRPKSVLAD